MLTSHASFDPTTAARTAILVQGRRRSLSLLLFHFLHLLQSLFFVSDRVTVSRGSLHGTPRRCLLLCPSLTRTLTPHPHPHPHPISVTPFRLVREPMCQVALAKRVAAAAASVYAGIRPLPSELNPVLRPLVWAVKKEPDAQRRGRR